MSNRFVFLFIIFLAAQSFSAQNQTSKWYFGRGVGVDFMSSQPIPLAISSLTTDEGCTAISDETGNLLFYSDGNQVYDKSHAVMANGSGLMNSFGSCTQSSIVVKKPGANKLYYLFTLEDGLPPAPMAQEFRYSVIDMSLAAGMGSVTIKNVSLADSCAEKLAAVKHCNGTDVWVVVHEVNNNRFQSFLVSAAGVNQTPVLSNVGLNSNIYGQGQMKISPNGKKLGSCLYAGILSTVEVFDFDASTGIVNNPISFGFLSVNYGCEFSPDGTKFYANADTLILQWDLCAGASNAIIASQNTVGIAPSPYTFFPGSMQLALNGKIYINGAYNDQSLGVINNPNASWNACGYVANGLSTAPKYTRWGLPGFISSYFKQKSVFTSSMVSSNCTTATFSVPLSASPGLLCSAISQPVNNVTWYFGDPSSGLSNISNSLYPTHVFSSQGYYTVTLIVTSACTADTLKQLVQVNCTGMKATMFERKDNVRLYPIPASTILNVDNEISGKFSIFDVFGNEVYTIHLEKGAHPLDIGTLASGIYTFSGLVENDMIRVKFVKIE